MSLDQNERVLEVLDSKPDSRRIKIKSIASDRNLAEMATEITQKCKYIHPSRVEEVEQLLIKLNKSNKQKEMQEAGGGGGGSPRDHHHHEHDHDRDRNREKKHRSEKEKESKNSSSSSSSSKKKQREVDKYPPADMESLDDYLELLYQVAKNTYPPISNQIFPR